MFFSPFSNFSVSLSILEYTPFIFIFSKKVILGGGRRNFYPDGTPDPEYPNPGIHSMFTAGRREDNRNLTEV